MSKLKKTSKRNIGYYRAKREEKIRRKDRIIKSYRADNPPSFMDICDNEAMAFSDDSYGMIQPYWYVNYRGKLSKGKIHCSCPLCRYYGPSISEKKRMLSMAEAFNEYADENDIHTDGSFVNKLKRKAHGEKICLYSQSQSKPEPPANMTEINLYRFEMKDCA